MTPWKKILILEIVFLIAIPVLAGALIHFWGVFGLFLATMLFLLWCWEVFAYTHYRVSRQQELLHVLQTAGTTQAPVESVLRAYLEDRPREHVYRASLLFFVFPGYYWIHYQRSFDRRLQRLVDLLESGMPLDMALRFVPGVVSQETALAITVAQFSGNLNTALKQLPERTAPSWLDVAPRIGYPLLILFLLFNNLLFVMIRIVPRYEKMFSDFRMRLPTRTEYFVLFSRQVIHHFWIVVLGWLLLFVLINLLMFSSTIRWYVPIVSWVYRLQVRGQFLRTLGLMLETGKPIHTILDRILQSRLLPPVMAGRVDALALDLSHGQPLLESLARHGLITSNMQGLLTSSERTQNLPWALRELGDSLLRQSARVSHRLTMVFFPLAIFVCACLIGLMAVAMFEPLVAMLEKMHG